LRNLIIFCSILFLFTIYEGCATPRKLPVIGAERIVERSLPERPDWISTPLSIEEPILYFSGGTTGQAEFSLALRQAKAEAVKNITQGMKMKLGSEFSEALSELGWGDAASSEFLTDSLELVIENLDIHNLKPKEIYYEKIEKTTREGFDYFYNCYNLFEISEQDYVQARNAALNRIKEKAKGENKEKVEEIATKLLKRFSQ